MKFTIECDMKDRWVPHFLGMLKYMQQLGGMGKSRRISFCADGDGDFHPKFKVSSEAKKTGVAEPREEDQHGNRFYDAG